MQDSQSYNSVKRVEAEEWVQLVAVSQEANQIF
jgi:hypothetical protein